MLGLSCLQPHFPVVCTAQDPLLVNDETWLIEPGMPTLVCKDLFHFEYFFISCVLKVGGRVTESKFVLNSQILTSLSYVEVLWN